MGQIRIPGLNCDDHCSVEWFPVRSRKEWRKLRNKLGPGRHTRWIEEGRLSAGVVQSVTTRHPATEVVK